MSVLNKGGTNSFLLYFFVFTGITALCFVSYANTLGNPFIWDDDGLVVRNAFIRSPAGWHKAFSSDLFTGTLAGSNFYRPVQMLSYMLDYRIGGLRPVGYHVTNIILQILASFLVFVFLLSLTGRKKVSAGAALLFAVHPVHSEVAAYIAGRADTLMAVGILSAMVFFIGARRVSGARCVLLQAVSLLCFIFALLSKELSAVFPLAVTGWVLYYEPGKLKRPWYVTGTLLPYFVITALYALLRLTALRFGTLYPPELAHYPFGVRFMALPSVVLEYLGILFFPVGLHMSRTLMRPVTPAGQMLHMTGAGMLAVSVIAVLLSLKRAHRTGSFLFLWSLLFFLPQSGLVPINAFVAEHFIYLSSISFFFLVCWVLAKISPRRLAVFILGAILVFSMLLTAARNYEWRDAVVFYRGIIERSPASFLAHNNLGVEYVRSGNFEQAVSEFEEARRIKPFRIEPYSNLADLYFRMNDYENSLAEYKKVEQMVPYDKAGQIQNNIGTVLEAQGRLDEALARFRLALRLDPGLYHVYFNIARVHMARGALSEATVALARSFPGNRGAQDFMDEEYLDIISRSLRQAGEQIPAVPFYNNLGVRFAKAGFVSAARRSFMRAIEISPSFTDAHFNLALLELNAGNTANAVTCLETTLKIRPDHHRAFRLLESLEAKK